MRILTLTTLLGLACLVAAGCSTGDVSMRAQGDGGVAVSDAATGEASAEGFFEARVLPILGAEGKGCVNCHGGSGTALDFLRPNPDVRTQLLGTAGIVDLVNPTRSRLLAPGTTHVGTNPDADDVTVMLSWLELEQAARRLTGPADQRLTTDTVEVAYGFNTLSLERLGSTGALRGASLHFTARWEAGSTVAVFSDMRVTAGRDGVRLVHPMLTTTVAGVSADDESDRFGGLDVRVEPGQTADLGPGSVFLTGFPEGSRLSFRFDAVEPTEATTVPSDTDGGTVMPTPTVPGDGCAQLGAFRMFATGPLTTSCTSCHGGGNPRATASVDMREVDSASDTALATGCNQILGRIPATAPETSGLFVQPAPGGPPHPFHFSTDADFARFRDGILNWHAMEVGR